MKYLVLIVILVFNCVTGFSQAVVYTCPMHPEVQLAKPGDCPKCVMTLVKMEPKKPVTESEQKIKKDPVINVSKHSKKSKETYACPMHPEVQSDKPGKCSKCGMNLVKQEAEKNEPSKKEIKTKPTKKLTKSNSTIKENSAEVFTCPMHPEVQSTKPGKCPKCGMDLVKKVEAKISHTNEPQINSELNKPHTTDQGKEIAATKYTCAMHPEILSDKPGTCPKCGMVLIKKQDNQHHNHEAISDSTAAKQDERSIKKRNINLLPGKKITYHLYVTDTMVNFTGKRKHAFAVNGSIPAPTLEFTEGDTAEIFLHNKLNLFFIIIIFLFFLFFQHTILSL